MGRPRPCGACDCCYCWDYEVDSFDADDWDVIWDAHQPFGADSVAFNGDHLLVTLDDTNTAYDSHHPGELGVWLIHKRWTALKSTCPFLWGLDAVCSLVSLPPQDCVHEYGFSVCGAVAKVDVDPWQLRNAHAEPYFDEEFWHYRRSNVDFGAAAHDLTGDLRYGLHFRIFAHQQGQWVFRINAPLKMRYGCCEMPRWKLPNDIALPNDQPLMLKTVIPDTISDDCNSCICDGAELILPDAGQPVPPDWDGPVNLDKVILATADLLQRSRSCSNDYTALYGNGYLTYDRPHLNHPCWFRDSGWEFWLHDGRVFAKDVGSGRVVAATIGIGGVVACYEYDEATGSYTVLPLNDCAVFTGGVDIDADFCGEPVHWDGILHGSLKPIGWPNVTGDCTQAVHCNPAVTHFPTIEDVLSWDDSIARLRLSFGRINDYIAPADALDNLVIGNSITFTRKTRSWNLSGCKLPDTLTLDVVPYG